MMAGADNLEALQLAMESRSKCDILKSILLHFVNYAKQHLVEVHCGGCGEMKTYDIDDWDTIQFLARVLYKECY